MRRVRGPKEACAEVPARLARARIGRVSENVGPGQSLAVPGGTVFALFRAELMGRFVKQQARTRRETGS